MSELRCNVLLRVFPLKEGCESTVMRRGGHVGNPHCLWVLTIGLVLGGTLLLASPATAESWVNSSNNYCLDTDGRAVNGGAVRMWKCEQHPNQLWIVRNAGNGLVRLINRSSNFCLDTDGSRTNGGQVRMWGCVNHPNQLWQIQNLLGGHYRLLNKASGFCLDSDGSAVNGGAVRMWQCVSHPHQTWKRPVRFDDEP
jgi:hypothetical protein